MGSVKWEVCICCCQMCQLLVAENATVNVPDKQDRRAVHWAAFNGHREILQFLAENGALLGVADKQVL